MRYLDIADTVSTTFLVTFIVPIGMWVATRDRYWPLLVGGILIANVLVAGIKEALGNSGWLGRPAGASGCDALCIGGSAAGEPGMPSGHVTTVTMFVLCLWLRTGSGWVLAFGLPWVAAVAWSRWYKNCHNWLQIVGGLLFGSLAAGMLQAVADH